MEELIIGLVVIVKAAQMIAVWIWRHKLLALGKKIWLKIKKGQGEETR